jgi:hypothetical protein
LDFSGTFIARISNPNFQNFLAQGRVQGGFLGGHVMTKVSYVWGCPVTTVVDRLK